MANYCYNEVALSGEPGRLLKGLACFARLAEKPVSMPDFITADQGHFLDLSIGDNNLLGFRTRWNPNLNVMAEVSRHFGLDHRHFYYEPMMGLVGEAILNNGTLSVTRLIPSDLYLPEYDAACEQWSFRGEVRDTEYAIHRFMLDEKRRLVESDPVKRRLAGLLPHIDLAGTDFIVDWRLKELREKDAPWNRINLKSLLLNDEGDGYLCFYHRELHEALKPSELSRMSAAVCLLEFPNELLLDPVGLAREHHLPEDDFLLAYPYQEKRLATVTELSEVIQQQAARQPRR